MEYKLITAGFMGSLGRLVEEATEDGWIPQGGVAVYEGAYYQAMVKCGKPTSVQEKSYGSNPFPPRT